MAPRPFPHASLVLVELGAAWPASLIASPGPCRVLAEVEGEGPLAFASRADAFASEAFPRGTQVSIAFVACNQRADETAEAARRALAECLLTLLSPTGALCFSAADDATDRFRRRLLDLAGDLCTGAAVGRVRASFGDENARTASGPATSQSAPASNRPVARVA